MKAIQLAVLIGFVVAGGVLYVRIPDELPAAIETSTDLPVRMVFHI